MQENDIKQPIGTGTQDPNEEKGNKTRRMAGRALLVFFALMIALTWASRMLEEMTIATVTVANIQRGALEKQIRVSGTLTASQTVPVVPDDSARVLNVYVKTGADIKAGDSLFRLSYTDAAKASYDALQTARQSRDKMQQTLDWAGADLGVATVNRILQRIESVASLETAYRAEEASVSAVENPSQTQTSRLAQLRNTYETEKRLLDSDKTARDYIGKLDDAANAADKYADACDDFLSMMRTIDGMPELATVDAALSEYTPGKEYTRTYTAEVTGTVLELSLAAGSMASTSSPALTLSDLSGGLSLSVTVTEDEAEEMAVGDMAQITIGSQRYDSPIESIVAAADGQSASEVSFSLPQDAGAPGSHAEMLFTKRTQNYDIIIPLSALRHDSDGDFVYSVEQVQGALGAKMSVRRVDVHVLDQDSGRAALQSGVSQRDVIVERSDRNLQDGDRVRLSEGS